MPLNVSKFLAALSLVCAVSPALAQSEPKPPAPPQASNPECLQLSQPAEGTTPNTPLLLNKCTGSTWMLVRVPLPAPSTNTAYRWLPLQVSDAEGLFPAGQPTPPSAAKR